MVSFCSLNPSGEWAVGIEDAPWLINIAEGAQGLGLLHWVSAGAAAAGYLDGPCSPETHGPVGQANTHRAGVPRKQGAH